MVQQRGEIARFNYLKSILVYKTAHQGLSPAFDEIGRGARFLEANSEATDEQILAAMNNKAQESIKTAVLKHHLFILEQAGALSFMREGKNIKPRTISLPGEVYLPPGVALKELVKANQEKAEA